VQPVPATQPKQPFSRVHSLPNLSSMPPKSKPKLTLAEKRKAGLPSKSAKRPKTDDSVTPEKSIGAKPEASKNNIINLAAKSQPLPDAAYFNPTAVKLFDEVKVYLELDFLIS
jgi:hypothetical protein